MSASVGWLPLPARAVVDANPLSNTNPPTDGAPWANVGAVGVAGGTYLGAGWALTAAHVGAQNITLLGTVYQWDGTAHRLTNSDGSLSDGVLFHLTTLPPLPSLPLSSSTPSALSQVDMIGFGFMAGSPATTFSPGTIGFYWSANPGKSWGNNRIDPGGTSFVNDGFADVVAFSTTFDAPPLQTSDECQVANFDSGGGVFYNNGGVWEQAGIIVAINQALTNRPYASAVYTDQTYAVDLATYRDQIVLWIEATIPSLSIARVGTNVSLSWPDTGVTYNLEATPSFSPENWTTLSPPVFSTNGQMVAVLPLTGNTRYFRLQKQ
jgi:hypothetical protein